MNLREKAHDLTGGDRQEAYGHPIDNFSTTAGIMNHLIAANKSAREGHITAEFAQVLMLGVKLARLARDPSHHDTLVDIAGYARTIEMTLDERAKMKSPAGAGLSRSEGT